jgi:hypothetical protein
MPPKNQRRARANTPSAANKSVKKLARAMRKLRAPRPSRPAAARQPRFRARVAPLPMGMANGMLSRVVEQLVNPGDSSPLPIGTCTKALVAPIEVIQELNFLLANALMMANPSQAVLPPGDMFVIATRSPLWAQILYEPNLTNATAGYVAFFTIAAGPSAIFVTPVVSTPVAAAEENYPVRLPIVYWGAQNPFMPYGAANYSAQHTDGRSYNWLDATAIVGQPTVINALASASAYANGEAITVTLIAYLLQGTREEPKVASSNSVVFFAGNTFPLVLNLTQRGYYAFEVEINVRGNAVATDNISVTITNLTVTIPPIDFISHLPAPGIAPLLTSMSDIRLTGVSILATNVSAELYQSGDVLTTQIPAGAPWDDWIYPGSNFYAKATTNLPRERWDVHKWQRGAYSWLKPNDIQENLFHSPMQMDRSQTTGFLTALTFSPYTTSDYLLTYVRSSSAAGTPSVLGRFCLSYSLQYSSLTVALSGEYSSLTTASLQQILDHLRMQPQFFENPLHFAAILSIIARIASAVARAVPTIIGVAKGVGTVASAVGAGISAYNLARDNTNQSSVDRGGYLQPMTPDQLAAHEQMRMDSRRGGRY